MDGNHPGPIDPRPKRRRDKDNPYKIFTTGIESGNPRYYISFRDVTGACQCVQIERELYETFDRFELEDLSHMNKVERHHEQSFQTEASLHKRAIRQELTAEDLMQQRLESQALRQAISQLSETQRRRLTLYYFDGLTYQQIAEMEGCKYQAVQETIYWALKKLKNFLK